MGLDGLDDAHLLAALVNRATGYWYGNADECASVVLLHSSTRTRTCAWRYLECEGQVCHSGIAPQPGGTYPHLHTLHTPPPSIHSRTRIARSVQSWPFRFSLISGPRIEIAYRVGSFYSYLPTAIEAANHSSLPHNISFLLHPQPHPTIYLSSPQLPYLGPLPNKSLALFHSWVRLFADRFGWSCISDIRAGSRPRKAAVARKKATGRKSSKTVESSRRSDSSSHG